MKTISTRLGFFPIMQKKISLAFVFCMKYLPSVSVFRMSVVKIRLGLMFCLDFERSEFQLIRDGLVDVKHSFQKSTLAFYNN